MISQFRNSPALAVGRARSEFTEAAVDGMILIHNYADTIFAFRDYASGAEDASASLPVDEEAGVSEEPVLSRRRMGAVAIITGLIKLLGLAGARWHDLFW